MKKFLLSALFVVLSAFPLLAQFVIQGEFRPRFELRRGYRNILAEKQDDAFFISQRTRLGFTYTLPKVSFALSIQDVRVWGDETLYSSTGVMGDEASLELNEAWINISLYTKGNLKFGRMYWAYDDERILSYRNWGQGSMKYDGVLFQHHAEGFQLDLGLSWNSSAENIYSNYYPANKMKTMNFIWARKAISDWATASATVFLSGFTETDTTSDINLQQTYAAYFTVKKGNVNAQASGFYQAGKSRAGLQTSAYMFSVKGNYKMNKVTLGAGIDYISGRDASNNDPEYAEKEHFFDLLYGNTHSYYGHLDLFTGMGKATAYGGLVDLFLNISWKFVPKATFNTDLHYFSLQNNVIDKDWEGTEVVYLDKALGPEADLNISWDILDFLNLKGGYSIMLPKTSMEKIQIWSNKELQEAGTTTGQMKAAQWVWIMVTAKPVFFDSSKKDQEISR